MQVAWLVQVFLLMNLDTLHDLDLIVHRDKGKSNKLLLLYSGRCCK